MSKLKKIKKWTKLMQIFLCLNILVVIVNLTFSLNIWEVRCVSCKGVAGYTDLPGSYFTNNICVPCLGKTCQDKTFTFFPLDRTHMNNQYKHPFDLEKFPKDFQEPLDKQR